MDLTIDPISVRFDASTACQLKCPSCPTAQGETGKSLGNRFLKLDTFKQFLDKNPTVMHVELSNWGEVFLNPELSKILKYAYEQNVMLTVSNGANLNTVKPEVLEAVVKYKLRHITCSIDGASQETYPQYRVGGNFDQVIENIKKINDYKKRYRSEFPLLMWQYIVFGHNEHEIQQARQLAKALNMNIYIKLSWDEEVSPVRDKELVRQETTSHASSRSEYAATYGTGYLQKQICQQLWTSPQINADGRILGCCFNYWGDFGHIFETDDCQGLNTEKMAYGKQMLTGKAVPREDIPCTTCQHYKAMQANQNWLSEGDLKGPLVSGLVYELTRRFGRPFVWIANRSSIVANLVLKPAILKLTGNLLN